MKNQLTSCHSSSGHPFDDDVVPIVRNYGHGADATGSENTTYVSTFTHQENIQFFSTYIIRTRDVTQTSVEFTGCWTEQPDTNVEGVVDKHGNRGNLYLKINNNNLKI
jgi:hypothetical protein